MNYYDSMNKFLAAGLTDRLVLIGLGRSGKTDS